MSFPFLSAAIFPTFILHLPLHEPLTMQLPFFYIPDYSNERQLTLDEDTSKHVIQVLRMTNGQKLNLTDGKGTVLTTTIVDDHKKHCSVHVEGAALRPRPGRSVTIAVSLVKNNSRFEWFLEKATEIGVTEIIPLVCERTAKDSFRFERMQGILISAMLQSRQSWLPVLHKPLAYPLLFRQEEVLAIPDRYIAHCIDENDALAGRVGDRSIVLIGPEGDFTQDEVELALANQFVPVTLGQTRLRTETAALVAATLLKIG